MAIVSIDYFLRDSRRFLWGVFGIDYPGVGPLSGYLCRVALLVCDPEEKVFLSSTATQSELERFSKIREAETLRSVMDCLRVNGDARTQYEKAEALVGWLKRNTVFRKKFQQHVDRLYREGVSFPKESTERRWP